MSWVIFSIDNATDVHTLAKFLRHIDTQDVMYKMKGKMIQCIGSYQGKLEISWIIGREDFDKHVRNSGYVNNQESFLYVSGKEMNAELYYQQSGVLEILGRLEETSNPSGDFTYRPDIDIYWSIKNV